MTCMESPGFYAPTPERKETGPKTVAVNLLEVGDAILCNGVADVITQRIERSDEVHFMLKSGESVLYDKTDQAEVPA